MISSLIAYSLYLSTRSDSTLFSLEPNILTPMVGTTTTRLRSLFDTRSLAASQPILTDPDPLLPTFQLAPNIPTPPKSTSGEVFPSSEPTANTPKNSASDASASKSNTPEAPTAPSGPETGRITISLVNAPLDTVLSVVTQQTGMNFLLIADPMPKITIHAKNRNFVDLLGDVSALTGLSYLKVGNEYVVASDDKLKTAYPDDYAVAHPSKSAPAPAQEPTITESYHTDYCDANKLITAIQPQFKDSGVTMIAAPASTTPSLAQQDQSQVNGVSSSVLANDQENDKVSRVVVVQGPHDKVEDAISLMRKLDVAPAQVNIAVTINDLSLDAEKNLGLTWQFGSTTLKEQQPNGIGFASFDRSPLSFTAAINALQTQGKDKLLASPNITVLDGQRAYILVGQRLEFPVIESLQTNGQPLYNVQEERVGIYLQVSVWVTNDGKVKLQLYPQVSTVTGFSNINGGSYPQIATREAQTTLTVGSGNTIIIGGLIHDEDIVNMQKVPILSQIPILGQLFTSRDHQKARDEVVISITPTISKS